MKIGAFLGSFKYGISEASLPKVSAWLMAVALVAGLVLVLVCRGGKVAQALVLVCGDFSSSGFLVPVVQEDPAWPIVGLQQMESS